MQGPNQVCFLSLAKLDQWPLGFMTVMGLNIMELKLCISTMGYIK